MKTIIIILFGVVVFGLWFLSCDVHSESPIEIDGCVMRVTLTGDDFLTIRDTGSIYFNTVSVRRRFEGGFECTFKEKLDEQIKRIVIYRSTY